jgi:D-glycero-alpha-D-manno-heptose-7-phosphate kinase
MIISRTPLRISFVGGGTDLRSFYSEEPGQVLSAAIDKYLYVVVKRQVGIVEHKYRINWSQVEFRDKIEDIQHPIIREALRMFNIDFPIEISTFADIPANTGLGSSSAFAVGLMHALHALKGEMVTKYVLASEAANIEVDILKRVMGKQDHFASAYGDLNVFTFNSNETVSVEPVFYQPSTREALEQNLILFYTRLKRDASEILENQNLATSHRRAVLRSMKEQAPRLREILSNGSNLDEVGEILHNGWHLKKSLTDEISSPEIDEYYEKATKAGALGGKLLGAGGGGFLLFYVEPKNRSRVIDALAELYFLNIKIDCWGTRITYYDQDRI